MYEQEQLPLTLKSCWTMTTRILSTKLLDLQCIVYMFFQFNLIQFNTMFHYESVNMYSIYDKYS